MMAAELGHAQIIKLLLAHGAAADRKDNEGKTAIDLAEPAVRSTLDAR
jgi:ankyrin repeat protein